MPPRRSWRTTCSLLYPVSFSRRRSSSSALGGAKVSDKLKVIKNLLGKVDTLIVGGGMAYTFLKAQGLKVGNSLCEDEQLGYAKEMLDAAAAKGVKFLLPVDNVIADKFPAEKDASDIQMRRQVPGREGRLRHPDAGCRGRHPRRLDGPRHRSEDG